MSAIVEKLSKVGKFFKKVRMELNKVNWPSKKDLGSYTMVVLITVTALVIFLGIVDLIFGQIITPIIM